MTRKHASAGRHRADRQRSLKRRVAVVAGGTAAVVLLGSATAYAYWSITGTGSGSAAASSMTAPTVGNGTVSGPALYPGSTGGTLTVKASNPNPFPVTVTVAQDSSGTVTGCTTPAVTFSGGSFTLPANASNEDLSVTASVSMGAGASNDCQGKTLTVPLTTSSVSG